MVKLQYKDYCLHTVEYENTPMGLLEAENDFMSMIKFLDVKFAVVFYYEDRRNSEKRILLKFERQY